MVKCGQKQDLEFMAFSEVKGAVHPKIRNTYFSSYLQGYLFI